MEKGLAADNVCSRNWKEESTLGEGVVKMKQLGRQGLNHAVSHGL